MIIDSHVHVSESGKWFGPSVDASLDTLLLNMDAAAVNKAVLIPVFEFC